MDNGPTFEKPINLNNHSGWSINPQTAVPEDNKVYVAWTNNASRNEEIYFNKVAVGKTNCVSFGQKESRELNLDNKNNTSMGVSSKNVTKIAIVDRSFTDAASR